MDPTGLFLVILQYVIYVFFTVKIQHMIKHLNANLPKNGRNKKNLRGHVKDGHFSHWPWTCSMGAGITTAITAAGSLKGSLWIIELVTRATAKKVETPGVLPQNDLPTQTNLHAVQIVV